MSLGSRVLVRLWGAALCIALAGTAAAQPASDVKRGPSFWDLRLASHARELATEDYIDYACGTNGGPPASPIPDWTAYAKCPAEKVTGLHEVQFRYDDEAEYWARAQNLPTEIQANAGTKLYDIDAILSALFDDDGFLVGLRAVSEPRVSDDDRLHSIALRSFLLNRFDPNGWVCQDAPLAEGEQPVGSLAFKEQCDKTVAGTKLHLESNFYRKKGQSTIDPRTGVPAAGQFRSDVRFEIFLDHPVPDRADRLAAANAASPVVSPLEKARQQASNCPGCDLTGINLKRQNLKGANLAGANLAGADLHAANLEGADLTGANLTDAVLNRANLRRAKLTKAILANAQLFAAALDGAALAGADLTDGKLGEAQLTRADLSRAKLLSADFTKSRMLEANLRNAEIEDTYFTGAQMSRSDLSGAAIKQADFTDAALVDANLSGSTVTGTDLFHANLRHADLSNAHFSASRLTEANLSDTKQVGAVFEDMVGSK